MKSSYRGVFFWIFSTLNIYWEEKFSFAPLLLASYHAPHSIAQYIIHDYSSYLNHVHKSSSFSHQYLSFFPSSISVHSSFKYSKSFPEQTKFSSKNFIQVVLRFLVSGFNNSQCFYTLLYIYFMLFTHKNSCVTFLGYQKLQGVHQEHLSV